MLKKHIKDRAMMRIVQHFVAIQLGEVCVFHSFKIVPFVLGILQLSPATPLPLGEAVLKKCLVDWVHEWMQRDSLAREIQVSWSTVLKPVAIPDEVCDRQKCFRVPPFCLLCRSLPV